MLEWLRVVVKGGGDIASGVAHRMHQAGMRVVVTELEQPMTIRRAVSFASAVYDGRVVVDGLEARLVAREEQIPQIHEQRMIPVVVDPSASIVQRLGAEVVVDGIMAKRNVGTRMSDAPVVIGLGPGFTAGVDVHAVVETSRGHYLGKVITEGSALADTGVPGEIGGHTLDRVLRAPCSGRFLGNARIGDRVEAGDVLAHVGGEPLRARIDGVLRGILHDGLHVKNGQKVGDVDPRGIVDHCFTISDKARAVGGGVLEAILHLLSEVSNSR